MKGKGSLILIVALSVGLILALYGVGGAASTKTVPVTANVQATAGLQMPNSIDFGNVDPEGTGGGAAYVGNDYAGAAIDGAEYTQAVAVQVKSNKPWNLNVYKDGDLTAGAATIPNGQLAVSGADVTDDVFALAPGKDLFAGAQAKSAKGNPWINVPLTYKLLISWADDPAAYSANHEYSVIQP